MERSEKCTVILVALVVGLLAGAEPSHATVLDNFGTAVLGILNNTFLRTAAIAAVIICGVLALGGHMAWRTVLIVLAGIVVVFGAPGIVDYIRDQSTTASTAPFYQIDNNPSETSIVV